MLETPLSLTPNLHEYAQCIRTGNKCNYQPKKVWNTPTWVETSIRAEWGGGGIQPSGESFPAPEELTKLFTLSDTDGEGKVL